MARSPAGLPAGVRLSDHVSLGVIAKTFPLDRVRQVLAETGRASERRRDLPAHVMVYYAIALALYTTSGPREVLRCLLEGLRWLWGAEAVRVAGKSGISQARTRLGEAPLRRLYERVGGPGATSATKGARYRAWRLVSLDGSCLDVADTAENEAAFGRPGAGRGESAFPQVRFVALVENGTHGLFGARLGSFADGETTLAHDALTALRPGMLCLADRQFFGHALWREAVGTGADLLWRGEGAPRGRPRARRRRPAVAGEARPAAAARDGARRRLLPEHDLPRREGPTAPDRRHAGAGGRVPLGGRGRGRAAVPAGDDDPRPGRGARDGAGGPVPRAVGDRGRAGRAEDPPARRADGPAQQDAGLGPAGVLGAAAGALRGARADARGGAARRRGPRPALLPARRTGGAPQAAPVRRAPPLGPGPPCMRRCWPSSWRSGSRAAEVGGCRAGSSAR